MAKWSDGRERSERYRGSSLDNAIMDYFEDPMDAELKMLRDSVSKMRAEKEAFRVADEKKTMAAVSGGYS